MKKLCRHSGKRKYDSHEQAAVAAGESMEKHPKANVTYLTTYPCRHCNKWHITCNNQDRIYNN